MIISLPLGNFLGTSPNQWRFLGTSPNQWRFLGASPNLLFSRYFSTPVLPRVLCLWTPRPRVPWHLTRIQFAEALPRLEGLSGSCKKRAAAATSTAREVLQLRRGCNWLHVTLILWTQERNKAIRARACCFFVVSCFFLIVQFKLIGCCMFLRSIKYGLAGCIHIFCVACYWMFENLNLLIYTCVLFDDSWLYLFWMLSYSHVVDMYVDFIVYYCCCGRVVGCLRTQR